MADVARVVQLLEAVQNPNNEQRNMAEKEINALSQLPIWPSGLLQIIGDARFSTLVKLSASLELKRCTRKYWHYDSPSSGPPPYTEEVKAFVRASFFATAVQHSDSVPILNALCDSFANIARHDYPGLWPGVDGEIVGGLASGDPARTIVTLRLLYALASHYAFKPFNDFLDGPSPMATLIAKCMPVFFPLARHLLRDTPTSLPAATGLRLCLKVYFRCVNYRFPEYAAICDKDSSAAWCNLCLDTLKTPLPEPVVGAAYQQQQQQQQFFCPSDPRDRAAWAPWKAKKWAARILERMAEKWGQPRDLTGGVEEGDFLGGGGIGGSGGGPPPTDPAEMDAWEKGMAHEKAEKAQTARMLPASKQFKGVIAPAVVEVVLGQLLAWTEETRKAAGTGTGTTTTPLPSSPTPAWLPPKLLVLYMSIIEASSDFKSVWVPLRPHMPALIQAFLPAVLRPTPGDLEDFEDDPQSWMLRENTAEFFSSDPRYGADRLLKALLEKRKKTTLPLLVGALQGGLGSYNAASAPGGDPLAKEAALRMLCTGSRVIRGDGKLRAMLDALLTTHVTPDLGPPAPPFLRVRALETWGIFVGCNGVARPSKLAACSALMGALGDPTSLPVRHTAAHTLSCFLASKACRAALRPHVGAILGRIFGLLGEFGLSSVVDTVQIIVDEYHGDMLSIAGPIAANLVGHTVKCMGVAAGEGGEGGGDDGAEVEEAAMSAGGCITIMSILVDRLQTPPPPNPSQSILWAEGMVVLKRDVIPAAWTLLAKILSGGKNDAAAAAAASAAGALSAGAGAHPLPPTAAVPEDDEAAYPSNEFLEEGMQLLCAVYDALELELPTMGPAPWAAFVALQRFIRSYALDWADGWATATDMALAAGGPFGVFHTPLPPHLAAAASAAVGAPLSSLHPQGGDLAGELVSTLEAFGAGAAEEEKELAGKVALSLLHHVRGGLDHLLPRIIALYAGELCAARSSSYTRTCSLVLCMTLAYNAPPAMAILTGGLPPTALPAGYTLNDVFTKWFAAMNELAGEAVGAGGAGAAGDSAAAFARGLAGEAGDEGGAATPPRPKPHNDQIQCLGLCSLLRGVASGAIPSTLLPIPSILTLAARTLHKEQGARASVAAKAAQRSATAAGTAVEEGGKEGGEDDEEEDVEGDTDLEEEEEEGGGGGGAGGGGGQGEDEEGSFHGSYDSWDEMDDDDDDGGEQGPLDHVNSVLFFQDTIKALVASPVWAGLGVGGGVGGDTQAMINVAMEKGAQLAAAGVGVGVVGPAPCIPGHPLAHLRVN